MTANNGFNLIYARHLLICLVYEVCPFSSITIINSLHKDNQQRKLSN